MLGPMITQSAIDKAPWYAKVLFYVVCGIYLTYGTIAYIVTYPVYKVIDKIKGR